MVKDSQSAAGENLEHLIPQILLAAHLGPLQKRFICFELTRCSAAGENFEFRLP